MKQKKPTRNKTKQAIFYVVVEERKNYVHGAFYEKSKAEAYKEKLEALHGERFRVVCR